jgi:hypothetical protein
VDFVAGTDLGGGFGSMSTDSSSDPDPDPGAFSLAPPWILSTGLGMLSWLDRCVGVLGTSVRSGISISGCSLDFILFGLFFNSMSGATCFKGSSGDPCVRSNTGIFVSSFASCFWWR